MEVTDKNERVKNETQQAGYGNDPSFYNEPALFAQMVNAEWLQMATQQANGYRGLHSTVGNTLFPATIVPGKPGLTIHVVLKR